MHRADSVFTATTGVAQRKRWNRFRWTILTPIRPPKIPPLIPTKGGEIGVRTVALSHICKAPFRSGISTALPNCSSLATPEARLLPRQPSNRYGVEWANYYTPLEHLALDFDLANSKALFTTIDEDDAAPNSLGGKHVPEAVGVVISSGITLHDYEGFSSSLRLRYFGPRDLTSDGIYRSNATVMLNGELGYQIQQEMAHFGRDS